MITLYGFGRVNDKVVPEGHSISASDLTDLGVIKLSFGTKRHAVIKPRSS